MAQLTEKEKSEIRALAIIAKVVDNKELTSEWKKADTKARWLSRANKFGCIGYASQLRDAFLVANQDDKRANNGGNTNAGAKKKIRVKGDEPKNTTVQIEPSVIAICRQKHGSLANALRFAAK